MKQLHGIESSGGHLTAPSHGSRAQTAVFAAAARPGVARLGEDGWFDPAHFRPIKRTVSVIPGSSRRGEDADRQVPVVLVRLQNTDW